MTENRIKQLAKVESDSIDVQFRNEKDQKKLK